MKLAIVRARYNAAGGAERFVQLASAALAAQGALCSIVARRWPKDSVSKTFEVISLDPFYIGSTWRDWSFARAVQKLVRERRFDLVQSHERIVGLDLYRAGDGVHAAWLERRASQLGFWARLGMRLNAHHHYLCHVERRMFEDPRLRAVVCNSFMVRDEIKDRFAVPDALLHVIYNGVDLNRFHVGLRELHRQELCTTLGLNHQQPVFLFIGSGFGRKGLREALTALVSLPDAALLVVGHDKHHKRYLDLARSLGVLERCRFVGAANDPAPYYGAADVLVLPTWYDPFPNVALEALASGVPIVVSNGCGAKEVVRHGENGFVVPVGDAQALAASLHQWLALSANQEQRLSMRSAARRSAEPLGVEQMAVQMLALHRELQSTASKLPEC